jgi:hypothetical protein
MNTRKLASARCVPRFWLACAAFGVLGFAGCSSDSGSAEPDAADARRDVPIGGGDGKMGEVGPGAGGTGGSIDAADNDSSDAVDRGEVAPSDVVSLADVPWEDPADVPLDGATEPAVDGPRMWSIDGGRFDVGGIDLGPTEAGSSCAPEGVTIPAGGGCGDVITQCKSTGWDRSCRDGALSAAASGKIWGCGGRCGDLLVGFSGGCATVIVELSPVHVSGSRSYEEMMACTQSYLFGTRFDCVPAEGWVQLHVDGCSLP